MAEEKEIGGEKPNAAPIAIPVPDDTHVLLANSQINDNLFGRILQELMKAPHRAKIILALVTLGGQANSAYRIARFLQDTHDVFEVFVPSLCKSAGTLICLGANRVHIDITGEIGPLDVQLSKRDELAEKKSGLLNKSSFEYLAQQASDLFHHLMLEIKVNSLGNVRFKTATDLAARMTVGMMSEVYKGFDLETIGEDFRDLQVAQKYAERLVKIGGNVTDSGIEQLVSDYPSHDFVIDRKEAPDIFKKVGLPPKFLTQYIKTRTKQFMTPIAGQGVVELLTAPPPPAPKTEDPPNDKATEKDGVEKAAQDDGNRQKPAPKTTAKSRNQG